MIASHFERRLRRLMRCSTNKQSIKLRTSTLHAIRSVVDKDVSMMGNKVRLRSRKRLRLQTAADP